MIGCIHHLEIFLENAVSQKRKVLFFGIIRLGGGVSVKFQYPGVLMLIGGRILVLLLFKKCYSKSLLNSAQDKIPCICDIKRIDCSPLQKEKKKEYGGPQLKEEEY